jgi:hypothetical protein
MEPLPAPPLYRAIDLYNDYSTYRSLSKTEKEMRVIILLPGTKDDPVRFHMQYLSLLDERRPQYEALSYCWGDAVDLESVFLVDSVGSTSQTYNVNQNLLAGLNRLRPADGNPRTLWINLLCIK